jgi:hypothetical protein
VAEGARLESVFRGNSNVGSNPTLSAITFVILHLKDGDTYTDSTLNRRHHRWPAHCPKK